LGYELLELRFDRQDFIGGYLPVPFIAQDSSGYSKIFSNGEA
jgi:hypothetical protein